MSETRRPIGVGIVGLGFMGSTHAGAYRAAANDGLPVAIRAICDRQRPGAAGGASPVQDFDTGADTQAFAGAEFHAELDDLLADPGVDLVSLCTPTDTHLELASRILRAGKDLLLEKPVALRAEHVRQLEVVRRESGRRCMVAMCMRFWPGWAELLEAARSGSEGAIRSARFQRLSQRPGWGEGFYDDPERCGGALFDLHVHDADFVRQLVGEPTAVRVEGTLDHPLARYRFETEGVVANAEGSWELGDEQPFQMSYAVEFERASWSWRISEPGHVVREDDRGTERLPVADHTGYDGEIRHLVDHLAVGSDPGCGLPDAARTVALLEAERESLRRGDWVELPVD